MCGFAQEVIAVVPRGGFPVQLDWLADFVLSNWVKKG